MDASTNRIRFAIMRQQFQWFCVPIILVDVVIVNGVVGCTHMMRTRGEGCCTGADSSTGIGSIVGSSCLLTVDFFLTFGLGHGVLTDPE